MVYILLRDNCRGTRSVTINETIVTAARRCQALASCIGGLEVDCVIPDDVPKTNERETHH